MINYNLGGLLVDAPFEVHEESLKFKDDMITMYFDKIDMWEGKGNNIEYDNPEYTSFIRNKFYHLIGDLFITTEPVKDVVPWVYYQTNEYNTHHHDMWHDHLQRASINAVYYIDPPKVGGNLQLSYLKEDHEIEIEKDRIYLFPGWMPHRPLPQRDAEPRLSINLEFLTDYRPIFKHTETRW